MKLNSVSFKVLSICILLLGSGSMLSCTSSQHSRSGQRIIPTAGGAIVEVEFYELKIHMPTVIPKGRITFRITNPSSNDHHFRIEGNGVDRRLDKDLREGERVDFTVDLQPGTYEVSCTMVGHPALGERLSLTVTP